MTVIKHTCQGTNDISHSHSFLLMGCESTGPKPAIGGLGVLPRVASWERRWVAMGLASLLAPF